MCAAHGALFRPETGECIGGPCKGKSLTAFQARIVDHTVVVMLPKSSFRNT